MRIGDLIRLGLVAAFVSACSSTPIISQEEAVASAMAEFQGYAKQTQQAMPTETPTPTENPDPFTRVTLPEGSGSLTKNGEQWIFNSPLAAEVGKNVPVTLVENWIAPVEHSEWPLFIQNEAGEWETALEYVEVKRPLLDGYGNPVPLSCDFQEPNGGDTYYTLDCIVVAKGPTFREENVEYLPVAISLDGSFTSPMYTFNLPFEDGTKKNLMVYPSRSFKWVIDWSIVSNQAVIDSVKTGDIFFVIAVYDTVDIDGDIAKAQAEGNLGAVWRINKMKENREKVRQIFGALLEGKFDPAMMQKLDLWIPDLFGAGS